MLENFKGTRAFALIVSGALATIASGCSARIPDAGEGVQKVI